VFISGDRQDSPFPNVNGCLSFSANTFRYTGTVWENIVCNGAHATSPHADSRDMQFDANGNLLQTNDGGIYRLVSRIPPPLANGYRRRHIRPTEYHSVAFDPLSKITLGGAQTTERHINWRPAVLPEMSCLGVMAARLRSTPIRSPIPAHAAVQQFPKLWPQYYDAYRQLQPSDF